MNWDNHNLAKNEVNLFYHVNSGISLSPTSIEVVAIDSTAQYYPSQFKNDMISVKFEKKEVNHLWPVFLIFCFDSSGLHA